jgi:hypothetical protein
MPRRKARPWPPVCGRCSNRSTRTCRSRSNFPAPARSTASPNAGNEHGFWWRYEHAADEPRDTLLSAIMIAGNVAAQEARSSGKSYAVARAATGVDAIYVFACDHPDARNAGINVMFEFTPDGDRIRRPPTRTATRH